MRGKLCCLRFQIENSILKIMAKIERFEDIEAWKDARKLDSYIFSIFQEEPASKDFPLKNQIFSSAGSVMDNIAEGFERSGNKEFHQFLAISKGSCGEVRSQLYRCLDRGYIDEEQFEILKDRCLDLSKQISGFMSYLRSSDLKGSKFN